MTKDYLCDKEAAEEAAEKIQKYYTDQGFSTIKVWVERVDRVSNTGKKLDPYYFIRSNIKMKTPSLLDLTS